MQTSSGLNLSFVLLCRSVLCKKYKKYFALCKLQGKIMLKIYLTCNVRDMELLLGALNIFTTTMQLTAQYGGWIHLVNVVQIHTYIHQLKKGLSAAKLSL